jgi:CheY-like chemotaxis protein
MKAAQGPSVIVVEDEALIAMDIQTLLENAGYRVLGLANSPAAAKALFSKKQPDLALLDINLGGQDILETASAFSAKGIEIIFLTGHSAKKLPEALRHHPLVGKPYMPDKLLEVIETTLARRKRKTAS